MFDAAVLRFGPRDLDELRKIVPAADDSLRAALDTFVSDGRSVRET